jgi:hypothetical protein
LCGLTCAALGRVEFKKALEGATAADRREPFRSLQGEWERQIEAARAAAAGILRPLSHRKIQSLCGKWCRDQGETWDENPSAAAGWVAHRDQLADRVADHEHGEPAPAFEPDRAELAEAVALLRRWGIAADPGATRRASGSGRPRAGSVRSPPGRIGGGETAGGPEGVGVGAGGVSQNDRGGLHAGWPGPCQGAGVGAGCQRRTPVASIARAAGGRGRMALHSISDANMSLFPYSRIHGGRPDFHKLAPLGSRVANSGARPSTDQGIGRNQSLVYFAKP